jgi:isocitrate dehydrogenase (NAD+)
MLRHLSDMALADRIERGLIELYRSGEARTRDLGGTASTDDFANALVRHVRALS